MTYNRVFSLSLLSILLVGCGGNSGSSPTPANPEPNPPTQPEPPVTQPEPPVEPKAAAACFNDALFKVGSVYDLEYTLKGDRIEKFQRQVLKEQSYLGQEAVVIKEAIGDTTYYFGVNIEEKSVELIARNDDVATTQYQPALKTQFNLEVNEKYQQSYTVLKQSNETREETVYEETYTFNAIEEIAVPAGRFKACRYELVSDITPPSGLTYRLEATFWYGVENGLLLRNTINGDTVKLLEHATINGKPINSLNGT